MLNLLKSKIGNNTKVIWRTLLCYCDSFIFNLNLSYGSHSIDLHCKSMDEFLYDRNLHERVKSFLLNFSRELKRIGSN